MQVTIKISKVAVIIASFIILIGLFSQLYSEVQVEKLELVANNFINYKNKAISIRSIGSIVNDNGKKIARLVNLSPKGFVILSRETELEPIIGYSFTNNLDTDHRDYDAFKKIIERKLDSEREYIKTHIKIAEKNREKWEYFANGGGNSRPFEQWPEPGTTLTGGWLETNWSQGAPYNQFCPYAPNTTQHSLTGCPSTALAQIINFHKELNATSFTNNDDYFTPNNYIIDDDYLQWGFPDFIEINGYLEQIAESYNNGINITDEEAAILSFSSGIAVKQQIYGTDVSGTYFSPQIENGFKRFGFENAVTLFDGNIDVFDRLAYNMKKAMPAQMSALQSGGGGHQIVVDGYNTDEEFHFNFGWGGTGNGWYSFPLSGMPAGLNIFKSVVLDINKNSENFPQVEFISPEPAEQFNINELLTIEVEILDGSNIVEYGIFLDGELINTFANISPYDLSLSELETGFHPLTIKIKDEEERINYKSINFEIISENEIFTEDFDMGFGDWEITAGIWENINNSLISFNEVNTENVSSATCPVAYSNLNTSLISPQIDLPPTDELKLQFYIAYPDQYPNYPGLTVKISEDNGSNWDYIWSTSTIEERFYWHRINIDISEYSSSSVKFAFDCNGYSYADISIDDIKIFEEPVFNVQYEVNSDRIEINNYPNPFTIMGNSSPGVTFSFSLPRNEWVNISVYNVLGQKVKTLVNQTFSKGNYSINWFGMNSTGKKVSSGVYLYKFATKKYRTSGKMLMID